MWESDDTENKPEDASGTAPIRGTGTGRPNLRDDSSMAAALAFASQLGFSVACPMVVFIGGGAWLDSQLGWGPWLLFLGVILGIASAAALFYQIAKMPASRRRKVGLNTPGAPYKVEEPRQPAVHNLPKPPTDKIDGNGH
jgi:hypothetical protein